MASAFGEPRPRESWRRLRYVASRARQLTATGRHSLRAFLDWIDGLERAEARDVESAEAEPDEDAVRILTIHASKGLEFPIVLLTGLGSGRGGGNDSVEVIADRQSGALAFRVAQEWRTAGFEEARVREQEMADAELVRLLYVATTRARDHLVLSLFRRPNATGSPAALIDAGLEGTAGLCSPLMLGETGAVAPGAVGPLAASEGVAWGTAEQERSWLARRRELVTRLGTMPHVGAAELMRAVHDDGVPADVDDGEGQDFARAVRSLVWRVSRGSVRLAGDADPLVVARARTIVESRAFTDALADPTCRRTVPLLGVVDGTMLDLMADLVYETADGVTLVGFDLENREGGSVAGTPSRRAIAGLLSLAFTAATLRTAHAVAVIGSLPGEMDHFTDTAELASEARAGLP